MWATYVGPKDRRSEVGQKVCSRLFSVIAVDSFLCRYAFMDFIVFSSILGLIVCSIMFSYDIACQWSHNLKKCIPQLPAAMRLSPALLKTCRFVIPKLHLHNHGALCQCKYNLNYLHWSAQSDLEDPECWWAHINPISMSTREMGEGSRIDTIDDHVMGWNWHKITGFGESSFYSIIIALALIK